MALSPGTYQKVLVNKSFRHIALCALVFALITTWQQSYAQTSMLPGSTSCENMQAFDVAKNVAEKTLQELQENKMTNVYSRFEQEYRQSVSENQFASLFQSLLDSFGKPLDIKFMSAECGTKLYLNGTSKPLWKFRYDVRTTRYDWGKYYLSAEVVFDKLGASLTAVKFGQFIETKPDFKTDQKPQQL
jgi:hypothetical protein